MMNVLAGHTVSQINKGNRVDFDNLDWETITDGWRTDKIESIVGKIKDANTAITMLDCVLSLSASGQIKPPARFVEKCYFLRTWREAVLDSSGKTAAPADRPAEPIAGAGAGQPQPFEIPQYLTEDKAEKMLQELEKTQGYGNKKVLDRTATPWVISSMPDWGKAAQIIQEKLSVYMCWNDWARLIGKTGKALKRAANKSTCTQSQERITKALNKLK